MLSENQAGTAGRMAEIDSEKRETGRPSKYRPEFCERVIEMGRQCFTPEQMAAELGVSRSTLISWKHTKPAFKAAMQLASTYSQAAMEKIGFEGLHDKSFNGQLWLKMMQARHRETYTERAELTGVDGAPLMRPTKIELIGVLPNRDAGERSNVIDISPNRVDGPEPEPTPEPAELDHLSKPEPMRSAAELLRLYDEGKADDLSESEDNFLTRLVLQRNAERNEEARARHDAEQAKKASGWNGFPPGIGGKGRNRDWVK